MAVLTDSGCQEVLCRFAGCLLAVVTSSAASAHRCMIKERGNPGIAGVTGIALLRAGDVLGMFTRGLLTIMASLTGAQYLGVIHV